MYKKKLSLCSGANRSQPDQVQSSSMAALYAPRDFFSRLPAEIQEAIGRALLTNIDPIPARTISNAEEVIALRALAKVSERFKAVFSEFLNRPISTHVDTFLRNNTFHFRSTFQLQHITTLAAANDLSRISAVELVTDLLGGVEIPDWPIREMAFLRQYTGLTSLKLQLGAFDRAEDYGYRRWMAKAPVFRKCAYMQVVREVPNFLPVLPRTVKLTMVIDSHADWDGPERWCEARAIVTLKCEQDASGKWNMVGEPDEKEEEVLWRPESHAQHARERLL